MSNSFSSIVKEEVIKYKWTKKQMDAIISTFIFLNKDRVLKVKHAIFGKILYIHLKDMGISVKVKQVKTHYELFIPKEFQESKNILNLDNDQDIDSAVLSALFIYKGSTNSPKSKFYHLDIRVSESDLGKKIIKILSKYYLDSKLYFGKNRILVYIKKSANISDFFKLINAHEGVMYFEDIRINRDFSNSLIRLNTIDIVNMKKSVEASQKQIYKINKLLKTDILRQYNSKYIRIANLRLEFPQHNLGDLTDEYNSKYNSNYTKSAINHWLRFIVELKDKYER